MKTSERKKKSRIQRANTKVQDVVSILVIEWHVLVDCKGERIGRFMFGCYQALRNPAEPQAHDCSL